MEKPQEEVKASRKMKEKYMIFEEMLQDRWEAGRAEGLGSDAQGLEVGRT